MPLRPPALFLLVVLILSIAPQVALAQSSGAVEGRVTVAASEMPLEGVNVGLEGTRYGSVTGPDGRYSITGVPAGEYTLVASSIGYESFRTNADNYEALVPEPLPQVEEASLEDLGPQPALLPAGQYVAAAEQAFPRLDVRSVRMPHAPGEAVYVDGQAGNLLTRDRANKVHLHPFTGDVLGVQRSANLGPAAFITDAADPLHFGYFGGLWTKVLWFVFGLLLSFSILSGAYLWVVRSATGRGARSRWLRGAVVSTALTLAYFGVVTVAVVQGLQDYAPQRAPDAEVARVEAGPYRVDVTCQAPCRPAEGAALTARFRGGGMPNLRSAALGVAGAEGAALDGPARAPTAEVVAGPGDTLALRLEARGGAIHEARFAAPPGAEAAQAAALPAWPDTAPGVWWVVGAFVLLTAGFILGWLWMVVRAFRGPAGLRASGAATTNGAGGKTG